MRISRLPNIKELLLRNHALASKTVVVGAKNDYVGQVVFATFDFTDDMMCIARRFGPTTYRTFMREVILGKLPDGIGCFVIANHESRSMMVSKLVTMIHLLACPRTVLGVPWRYFVATNWAYFSAWIKMFTPTPWGGSPAKLGIVFALTTDRAVGSIRALRGIVFKLLVADNALLVLLKGWLARAIQVGASGTTKLGTSCPSRIRLFEHLPTILAFLGLVSSEATLTSALVATKFLRWVLGNKGLAAIGANSSSLFSQVLRVTTSTAIKPILTSEVGATIYTLLNLRLSKLVEAATATKLGGMLRRLKYGSAICACDSVHSEHTPVIKLVSKLYHGASGLSIGNCFA